VIVAYLVNCLSPKEQFGGKERIISYNYQQASGIIVLEQYKRKTFLLALH
jgi:hypothetical protein